VQRLIPKKYLHIRGWVFPFLLLFRAVMESLTAGSYVALPLEYATGVRSLTAGIVSTILTKMITLFIERMVYDRSK